MNNKQIEACELFVSKLNLIWKDMEKKNRAIIVKAFVDREFNQSEGNHCFIGLGFPKKRSLSEWNSYPNVDDRVCIPKRSLLYYDVYQAIDLKKVFSKSNGEDRHNTAFYVADALIHNFVAMKWYNGGK